jgi:hypothetical protein
MHRATQRPRLAQNFALFFKLFKAGLLGVCVNARDARGARSRATLPARARR